MASTRSAARYASVDSTTSSPSSSASSLPSSTAKKPLSSALKSLLPGRSAASRQRRQSTTPTTSAAPSSGALAKCNKEQNFGSMVKKFMDRKKQPKPDGKLTFVVPASDLLKEELKKVGGAADKGSSKFSGLQRKLFQKAVAGSGGNEGGGEDKAQAKKVKALLCEGKENTRSLGMMLRSERELLNRNKEYEQELAQLKSLINQRNRDVENLENLCLKQREEIKALKEAILFPDIMNAQLQQLLDKQGSEVKQTNILIPDLQQQVSSLTGQLHCLAEDLARVKADKYAKRSYCSGTISSPQTPIYDEALNSQEFGHEDPAVFYSIDEMFAKDLNPCFSP